MPAANVHTAGPALPSSRNLMLHPNRIAPSNARPSRRGAVSKGCLIGAGVAAALVFVVFLFGVTLAAQYNRLVAARANVQARWSEIDNQYKRRYDLVPNLVETVKG